MWKCRRATSYPSLGSTDTGPNPGDNPEYPDTRASAARRPPGTGAGTRATPIHPVPIQESSSRWNRPRPPRAQRTEDAAEVPSDQLDERETRQTSQEGPLGQRWPQSQGLWDQKHAEDLMKHHAVECYHPFFYFIYLLLLLLLNLLLFTHINYSASTTSIYSA